VNKAIFLDKDGTLIEDVPYNVNPDLIVLKPNALEGLKAMQDAGFELIVISNQAGVARGYFQESALPGVWNKLSLLVAEAGIRFKAFYYCPNHPEGTVAPYNISCNFRKPKPGMLLQAAEEHQVDLSQSWMIGDILHDVEAGKRAGCRSILVDNGGETEWVKDNPYREPDYIVQDLKEAAALITHQLTPALHGAS
jgi:D-glycero-D-manno-heptose 1,7-bisphosphate phosphatase